MKQYRVRCTAMALVSMNVLVLAEDENEARELAIPATYEGTWSYQGVEDNTIETQEVTEC